MPPAQSPSLFRPLTVLLGACLCAGLTACTPLSRVVLLPQADAATAVDVQVADRRITLESGYQTAEVNRFGALAPAAATSEAEVQQRYPQLLALIPPPPQRFVLNFAPGTSDLVPESLAQLDTVIEAARQRAGGEIVVIGHTDRQGPDDANDALSLRRAQAVRDLFLQRGFRGELVIPVGRGEREPLVPTDDGVAESRNRRAEVIVR